MIKVLFIFVATASLLNISRVSGVLSTCASASPACSDEPNSVCEKTNGTNCVCIATYQEFADECAKISCTKGTECTDADVNSFCHTTRNKCDCKTNFVGTGVNCARKACSAHKDCKDFPNTYCATTGSDKGCTCGFAAPADSTTGACTPIDCTLGNAATTCTGGTVCKAIASTYQCVSKANYMLAATVSVQMGCVDSSDCTADSICTGGKCVCSSSFTSSGNKCKKECTGNGNGVCATDNATCIDGICECNVNYDGNGATCNQLKCPGNDASTSCNPNSQCAGGVCVCANEYVTDGTMCRKSCRTTSASTACSSNAICINDKCICKQTYIGDGHTCNKISCVHSSDCSGSNTNCSNGFCSCEIGYDISSTKVGCVPVLTTAATTAVSTTTTDMTTSGAGKTASSNFNLMFLCIQGLISAYATKM